MADENLTEIQETETSTTEPEVTKEDAPELPRDWIRLADGSTILCGAGHDDDRTLWVWLDEESGIGLAEAFSIFTNPEKTSHIERYYRENLLGSWDGYINLYDIKQNAQNKIDVGLRKTLN